MTPNWMGLGTAAATFFGIWMGHVGVRKIEAASPSLWIHALGALGLGAALEVGALLSTSLYLSGALGIVGMTFLWDALEFRRQHMRVRSGHAPANPRNPHLPPTYSRVRRKYARPSRRAIASESRAIRSSCPAGPLAM